MLVFFFLREKRNDNPVCVWNHRPNSEFFSTPLNPQFLFQQTRFKKTGNQRFRAPLYFENCFPPFFEMCVRRCVCVCLVCAGPALHPEWFDLTENPVCSQRAAATVAWPMLRPAVSCRPSRTSKTCLSWSKIPLYLHYCCCAVPSFPAPIPTSACPHSF